MPKSTVPTIDVVLRATIVCLLLFASGCGSSDKETTQPNAGVSGSDIPPELSEEKQQFIWDTEHITFEIETYVGKPLAKAVLEGDREGINGFLTDAFSATWVSAADRVVLEKSGVSERRWTQSATPPDSLSQEDFAERLLSKSSAIRSAGKARLRVLHISRPDEEDSSDAWHLKTLLTVSGRDADRQFVRVKQTASVVCRFGSDEEIRSGRIFDQWHVDSESVCVSPQLMKEVTTEVGLNHPDWHDNWKAPPEMVSQYSRQVAVADFDNDGYPDIAIADATGRAWLLQSVDGRKFRDVTNEFGLSRQLSGSDFNYMTTWLDIDNDGFQDLVLGQDLYRNANGKRFEKITEQSRLRFKNSPMSCAVADYDADGQLDLYVVYQWPRTQPKSKTIGWVGDDNSGERNELWRNLGKGKFQNVTSTSGVSGGRRHSFAAAWLHANEDHYPDLYVANDFAQNSFFINNRDGTFEDVSKASQTADFATSMGVATADIDNDGNTEIYVANMYSKMGQRIIGQVCDADYAPGTYDQIKGSCAGNRLYRRPTGDSAWQECSKEAGINAVGWAYAPAFADFDSDGLPDIYATTGFLSFNRGKPDG